MRNKVWIASLACLLMCGAASSSAGRDLTYFEFMLYKGYAESRLQSSDVTVDELAWLQRRLNVVISKYRHQQRQECAVYAGWFGYSCGYDCDCIGKTFYGQYADVFARYMLKTPYDGGGR